MPGIIWEKEDSGSHPENHTENSCNETFTPVKLENITKYLTQKCLNFLLYDYPYEKIKG
jgi:hypothetical protein